MAAIESGIHSAGFDFSAHSDTGFLVLPAWMVATI